MHEMSLVQSLLTQVEELAALSTGESIVEIRVSVGVLSGVEPELVASAFEQLAPQSGASAARLVLTAKPLRAQCSSCDQEFEMLEFRFRCPVCASKRLRVTGGEAMVLESIRVAEATPEGTA